MKPGDIPVKVVQVDIAKMPNSGWHDPELRRLFLDKIANHINFMLPDETLFCLILFGEQRDSSFVSNAERESLIRGIKDFIDKYERGETWDHSAPEGQA